MKFVTSTPIIAMLLLVSCSQQTPSGSPTAAESNSPKPSPPAASEIKGTPLGTVMTLEYVSAVGRIAYIWGWPLVNNLNRALAVEKLPEPGRIGGVLPASPPGYVSMLTDYISEQERFVTCPNQDTVYGAGYQRVDTKPVVIQVPDFKDRFFTYQIADARTDSFGQIGKQYGTKPGFYLLVGPNWKGTVPSGIDGVLHSPTDLVAVFPRVSQDDNPEDKAAIQPILSQIMVYPLTEFDGKMKTKDWKSTPVFPAPASTGGETKWVVPEKFFDQLPIVMKEIHPCQGKSRYTQCFSPCWMQPPPTQKLSRAWLQRLSHPRRKLSRRCSIFIITEDPLAMDGPHHPMVRTGA